MPSRRHVLGCSTSLLAASVAGCLTSERQSSNSTTENTPTTEPSDPTTSAPTSETPPTPDAPPTARERPYLPDSTHGLSSFPNVDGGPLVEGYEVGDGEYDNDLRIWNGAGARDGRLVLTAGDTELLAADHEVPEGGYLTVRFRVAADYTAEIRLGNVEHTVSIPSEQFDCNHWAMEVAMRETTAEDRTISTALACAVTTSETG